MSNGFPLFHGSSERISEIKATGLFGGLFATSNQGAAESHGDIVHVIESPLPLTNYVLNYEIDGAYEVALKVAYGDETIADAIMSADCNVDDEDAAREVIGGDLECVGWTLQALRGELAAKLGYTSVEMRDEHGTTWLCLPGCTIRLAANDER